MNTHLVPGQLFRVRQPDHECFRGKQYPAGGIEVGSPLSFAPRLTFPLNAIVMYLRPPTEKEIVADACKDFVVVLYNKSVYVLPGDSLFPVEKNK